MSLECEQLSVVGCIVDLGSPTGVNGSVNARCYPASLQVNGGPVFNDDGWSGFVAFDTPGLTLRQLEAVARYYYGLGYGFFCPTMVTASPEAYQTNLPVFRAAREHAWGQGILPPHLEGPFLAPECIGAHNPELRRDPTVEFAAKLTGVVRWLHRLGHDGSGASRCRRGDPLPQRPRRQREPGASESDGGAHSGRHFGGCDGLHPCAECSHPGQDRRQGPAHDRAVR